MITNYSPILLTVYNRVDHFKKCMTSLSNCIGADKTVVYVCSDGPKSESDIDKIKEIRRFTDRLKSFKKIELFYSDVNTNGKIKNKAVNQIYHKYDTYIRTEDDNIFSPFFLSFINDALWTYFDREDIFSVSGYCYPIVLPKEYNKDIFLWAGFSAWGVGFWKHKQLEAKADRSIDTLVKWRNDPSTMRKINNVSQHHKIRLNRMIKDNKILGDAYYAYWIIANNKYTVFPTKTYVKNIGNDGSGMHSKKSIWFLNQQINLNPKYKLEYEIKSNDAINKVLYKYFSNFTRAKKRVLDMLSYLFCRY